MVTEISKSDVNKERAALRRILKRANYATSDMLAADGPDHHEEVVIIRRINAGMVASTDYPPSIWRRESPDPDALGVRRWQPWGRNQEWTDFLLSRPLKDNDLKGTMPFSMEPERRAGRGAARDGLRGDSDVTLGVPLIARRSCFSCKVI